MTAKKTSAKKKITPDAANAVDEQLARYRSMRDFNITAEPGGGKVNTPQHELPFVIQKHAATRLHYDFRLGWNGVLKSWAVAKGPSYVTADKRLAVQVEDHPLEYGGFEGIIPRGQYGGGTVMVWDQGTWESHGDVAEGLRKGSLKFTLHGTKMHGNWALVRMGGRAANEAKPNWLLIKEHDSFERTSGDAAIIEEMPDSAVTGRTMEQIASASTHVWNSKDTAKEGQAWYRQKARAADEILRGNAASDTLRKSQVTSSLAKLPIETLPEFVKPQLAQETSVPPSGEGWLHEIKLDGYRIQARKHAERVQLFTRSGLDWTSRMKSVADAVKSLPVKDAILDGEVVVLDEHGISGFALLQASFEQKEKHPLTYLVFDLLHLDGHNTREAPLKTRKKLLAEIVSDHDSVIHFSEDIAGDGKKIFRSACELHAEGILSKRADLPYSSGRSNAWLKSKCVLEQEFVVGGFVDLSNDMRGVGSLLLGYYDDKNKLIYAGRTGTGFTQKTHALLRSKLDALETKKCPFSEINTKGRKGTHWVKPQLVVQVRFATWTTDNLVRQAAFLGLREDKPAKDVRRESVVPTAKYRNDQEQPKDTHTTKKHGTTKLYSGADIVTGKHAAQTRMPVLRLTHPEKVIDPESGVTKQQLMEYLWHVSSAMLPYIKDRPLSLVRCPEGTANPCFYQKHVNHLLPAGVGSVMVLDKKSSRPEPYITLNSAEALAGLAQMSVLEIHPWGSCNDELEHPDRIIIDLDPDESLPWPAVCEAAFEVRDVLESAGVESFVKTTGGKGLHVEFPIEPKYDFALMKSWTHGLVKAMEQARPDRYLTKMTKVARTGKIFLDYLRNERGATAIAPYSMRARAGMPVSMPMNWKDLQGDKRPFFTVSNFEEWKERLQDSPWRKLPGLRQSLNPAALKHFAPKGKYS